MQRFIYSMKNEACLVRSITYMHTCCLTNAVPVSIHPKKFVKRFRIKQAYLTAFNHHCRRRHPSNSILLRAQQICWR